MNEELNEVEVLIPIVSDEDGLHLVTFTRFHNSLNFRYVKSNETAISSVLRAITIALAELAEPSHIKLYVNMDFGARYLMDRDPAWPYNAIGDILLDVVKQREHRLEVVESSDSLFKQKAIAFLEEEMMDFIPRQNQSMYCVKQALNSVQHSLRVIQKRAAYETR